jgi:hypothetical protein
LFLFCLNKMDPSIHCVGERHAQLLHRGGGRGASRG